MILTRIRALGTAALVAATLAGCGDRKPEPPKMSEVFPNLPLPPDPRFVSRSGGEDALQLTVLTPTPRARVELYYREMLNRNGWKLVNQAKDAEGALVLLAEQKGPPLWVRIRSADDTASTYVEFSGARLAGSKPAS
jgi:hypothetical protein